MLLHLRHFNVIFAIALLFHWSVSPVSAQQTQQNAGAEETQMLGGEDRPETGSSGTETASEESEAKAPESSLGLIELFEAGGWAMWPLLLASVVGLGFILERLYTFFTAKLVSKGYNQELADAMEKDGLSGAKSYLESKKEEKISEVLLDGIDVASEDPEIFSKGIEREASEVITVLEKGLNVLAAVSTIAPLIGFLGTVSGMINAFDAIANADQVNAKVVAGGIKEALITTAAGLIIAIPVMAFYQYFTSRVNAFATEVEEAANRIYKEYLRKSARNISA